MPTYWIWFAELKLKWNWKKALLNEFHDPEDIYYAPESLLVKVPEITAAELEILEDKDLTYARKVLEDCARKGVGVLTFGDRRYPERMRQVYDAPLVLYYRGTFPEDTMPMIGVVGTRKATSYGLRSAYRLGAELAACGGRLVSGGALGVDTWATRGAMNFDHGHVLVLGGGVDVVYPKENKALFEQVAENGCLISEYPPGTTNSSWHFPRRNRIISALSHGVLVVEAPERSGALITAQEAIGQGRDLYVVPGNIDSPACAGSNALLKKGAVAVFNGWDLVQGYGMEFTALCPSEKPLELVYPELTGNDQKVAPKGDIPQKPQDKKAKIGKITIDKKAESSYSDAVSASVALTEQEKKILACIKTEPVSLDEVISACELPSGSVLSALTVLSMKGVVQMHPGRRVSLK